MKNALALDIGGTKIAAAVIDECGQILSSYRTETNSAKGPKAFVDEVIAATEEISEKYHIDCLGISSAGPLDPIKGLLINPTNLKTNDSSWGGVDLMHPLASHFKVPTILENDAAAAVIGELWQGNHDGASSLMSITLGTGVGIGATIEGRLQRCRQGFHPEVSHMTLNHTDKLAVCGCGNFGCIEAYLSGVNFPRYFARKFNVPETSGKQFVEMAKAGDSLALKGFELYSEKMAHAIHSLVLIYSPEAVIFSGSFSAAFPFFAESTKNHLIELLKDRREGLDFLPDLKLSKIADSAGLLGAAKMAFSAPNRL